MSGTSSLELPVEKRRSPKSPSHYVQENHDPFLGLFPHRFDYIWAPHALPQTPVQWQTETQHPLSDRLIEQGASLYGVRFGKETRYAMLDIDRGSHYHPCHDPLAIPRLIDALEPLGIVAALCVSSSYSGGLHLYLPFAQAQKSGSLALAIETLVERAGFKVAPGQLELFPDAKPYIANGIPQLYAAHRLPLQAGSYLLNDDWHPIATSPHEFVRRWRFCVAKNDVTQAAIRHTLKVYRRKQYKVSVKASKFLNDLNTEIEQGWSGSGQTNWLLGRIAMREYIFGHVLRSGSPLEGEDLVRQMVQVAIALPGYTDWCQHQHEIHSRAKDWARAVETSRYYHYGYASTTLSTLKDSRPPAVAPVPWNTRQAETAREKIQGAIAQLLNTGTLPAGATARFQALTKLNIGGSTLYRHRDLWHPEHLQNPDPTDEPHPDHHSPVESPPAPPPNSIKDVGARNYAPTAQSLLEPIDRNTPPEVASSDPIQAAITAGRKAAEEKTAPTDIPQEIQRAAHLEALERSRQEREQRLEQRHIERMQRYLASGDPILMAEAIAWIHQNPELRTGVEDKLPPPAD